ncbi:hypothetical protein B0H19DRAFT_581028 [Mycena capillaripes]|nr:hypothetical protein B0H19DRAFT_581028 [Mycena capillaripes]
MDNEPYAETNFGSDSTFSSPGSISYSSGMFSGAQNLTVTGHTLMNITYPIVPTVPSDVRMVPMGDIDLQHKIRLDTATGVVGRQREQQSVRRVYSAIVGGRSTTVAMYQGHGAKEEWRRDIAHYMTIRHPNIIQIRAAASSGGLHAIIFHDDLIPFEHFLNFHRHSHLWTVYIYAYCGVEFMAVNDYLESGFQQLVDQANCTLWIRPSTGRLCADLTLESNTSYFYLYYLDSREISDMQKMCSSPAPITETMIIESLGPGYYHEICCYDLSQYQRIPISTHTVMNIGAVVSRPSSNRLQDLVAIAWLPNAEVVSYWEISRERSETTKDGWTRFNSGDVFGSTINLVICLKEPWYWLSQANYIFTRGHITSRVEDYGLVTGVKFILTISDCGEEPPAGFLFLCPEEDFQVGTSSACWPDCPAYWSLDPWGVERLGADEATGLGFPTLHLNTIARAHFWDARIYAGLRQFHRAKRFDPDSQDLARHLGQPLYQLSNKMDPPFAHVDEEDSYPEDNQDEFAMDLRW